RVGGFHFARLGRKFPAAGIKDENLIPLLRRLKRLTFFNPLLCLHGPRDIWPQVLNRICLSDNPALQPDESDRPWQKPQPIPAAAHAQGITSYPGRLPPRWQWPNE